jgi:putative ABC transport system permease protein
MFSSMSDEEEKGFKKAGCLINNIIPPNIDKQASMLGNFNYFVTTQHGTGVNNWNQISYQTFLQLKSGSTLPENRKLLTEVRKKYYPDEETEARKNGWQGKSSPSYYGLQPLRDIHTNPTLDGGVVASIDPKKSGFY